ncbi:WD40 repeat [Macleaya cordata]|uniref:RING-type E3 ubiquitin transferase n=1 Tax=Macleaya cordata TaxID=56857 RepID=A0A200Q748_MACCD|nr:WD40 repeat [Macleaya cordata]
MAGRYKFPVDQKDIVKFLIATVGSFIQDRLINREQRIQHKEQCAERLASEDGGCDKVGEIQYSEQAVLANLDWGIDALEEAINTSNVETKLARLDHAEKMLQVCAMLNSKKKTAGVPNFYLSAWAHLNLSFLWKLRNNVHNSVLHILEMFSVDPFFSRIDFAPELWKALFLPHMSSTIGWYSEARHKLVMELIPDSADLSFTADLDQFFNESLIFTMRPDQAEKLQKLEQLYGQALDENTRLYAKYYKDCLNFDPTANRKVIPMLPIAEPPMTPLHEVSCSIPDYVKFGPILPTHAGFSPYLKDKDNGGDSRLNVTSNSSPKVDETAKLVLKGENEGDFDSTDIDIDSEVKPHIVTDRMRMNEDAGSGSKIQPAMKKDRTHSPTLFSPMDSPKSPKVSSPKPNTPCKRDPEPILRLSSSRFTNPTTPKSLPTSPRLFITFMSSSDSYMPLERSTTVQHGFYSFFLRHKVLGFCSYLDESEDGSQSFNSVLSSGKLTPQTRPPKDFICPITSQILSDPVTLETGQTYERRAIQEWLERGNTTCPITRQPLSATLLPKTNYVLKRLITSWKENYPDLAQEFSYSETPRTPISNPHSRDLSSESTPVTACSLPNPLFTDHYVNKKSNRFMRAAVSTSPTSVISQAASETVINGLKPYTSCLCTSENLQECEEAVLMVARIWKGSKTDPGVHSYLSKPTIVNGFVEILLASVNREVLRTSIYVLSELIFVDESVGETLTSVDSDFDCLAALLKNGLAEAAVLIYQLRPAYAQLSVHNLIPSLVQVILSRNDDSDDYRLAMDPKDAAIAILEQLLIGGDENSRSLNALNVISANGLPSLIRCLDRVEGRQSVVSILLCCMRADRSCRYLIANRAELAPVLELFHAGNDSVKGICIEFLYELVCLNRRTFCIQILQIIKDEGAFSTMHTFLVYLQMAPMEQQPSVASLLLQLDLLVEPRKMSIFREEAIEALIEALHRKDFPISQLMALDAFESLSGRLSATGKSLTEAWLLKIAGFDQPYNALVKAEKLKEQEDESTERMAEEEKAASSWEKRVAFVLCNHEKGSIFKALEECLNSNSLEMAKSCLVIATWLTYMLTSLPDTGVRDTARQCLLHQFINVLQSSRNLEEKVLAALALRSFINDKDALKELGMYAKSICKSLRKLKRSSTVVRDILKALMNLSSVNATELWSCAEVTEIDSGSNGEVLSLVHLKGQTFSSHSDGTIKVWDAGKRALRLIREVREHTKAVTCLFIPSSGDKLYSGSLDKTIRVWTIKSEEIHCIEVHDVKEAVHELAANTSFACFASQGTGIKVYNWNGVPKHINFNKNVKCLAMTDNKLYCGCTNYSIQEVDLSKCTSTTFFSGTKKLLGKQAIYALYIHDGLLFAGGSSVDGIAGKVFSLSTKEIIGSLPTGFDIHSIAVNNEFVFTGTKCGIIDICLRERLIRVASIKLGGGVLNSKVTCLISDSDGEMLFAGSSHGKIQAWALD